MKIHLYKKDNPKLTSCGLKNSRYINSDALEIGCGRCRNTQYFKSQLKRRLDKAKASPHFFKEHLRELISFDAYVLAWDESQQCCQLACVKTCPNPESEQVVATINALHWTVPVCAGQRVWFTAFCSQKWDEKLGQIPLLYFEKLIRCFDMISVKQVTQWSWTQHARIRQAQRQIPQSAVEYVLQNGECIRGNGSIQFQLARGKQHPHGKCWNKLKIITIKHQIITLYLNN